MTGGNEGLMSVTLRVLDMSQGKSNDGGSDNLMSVRNLSRATALPPALPGCGAAAALQPAWLRTGCAGASSLLRLASEWRMLIESQGRTSLTVLSSLSSQSSQLCSCTDSKGASIGNARSPEARIAKPSTQTVVG
eukprot:CAMPEP_0204188050 /NCGR_PEP_ID=MMETSP0361-20130328/57334_1 /ASSEMBLY_ACC=CAM_ASM_000343 /TAXON_ID=268821 /ORGANISM="Scrippsiella Hangoei, Strain SHTV-5" /LENGTH=134 /DNA_ID=CAMNT_0051148549 /DNA_START=442 /DNA_END=844 /DNA_ORIENTATION=+